MEPSFIRWVQQPGWDLKFGRDTQHREILIIDTPSWEALSQFLDAHTDELANAVASLGFAAAYVRYPGCKKPLGLRIPAAMAHSGNRDNLNFHKFMTQVQPGLGASSQPQIATPSLFIGIMRLTPALVPTVQYMLSHPEKKVALTRIQDNAQLLLTEASAQAMKSDGQEAVQRKSDNFWLSFDLQTLEQMYRDYGAVGFELTYTAALNKPKHDPSAQWAKFTTRYKLVEDDLGVVYREGELIDLLEIPRPAVIL